MVISCTVNTIARTSCSSLPLPPYLPPRRLPRTHMQLPHARAGSSTSGGWLNEAGVSFFGSGGGDSGTVDLLDAETLEWLPSLRTAMVHEFTACAGTGR